MSKTKDDSSTVLWPGDVANVAQLLLGISFLGIVASHHAGRLDVLDPLIVKDGFCVSNQDRSVYAQSHALCFYSDTVMAVALFFLVRWAKTRIKSPEVLQPVAANIPGIFFHGAAHLWIGTSDSLGGEAMEQPRYMSYTTTAGIARVYAGLFIFWFFLLRGVAPGKIPNWGLFLMALVANTGHVFAVPGKMAFTYVSTVLVLPFAVGQLLTRKTEKFYNCYALCLLPVGIIPFVEHFACTSVLQHLGGHFVYDTAISVGLTAYALYVVKYDALKAPGKLD